MLCVHRELTSGEAAWNGTAFDPRSMTHDLRLACRSKTKVRKGRVAKPRRLHRSVFEARDSNEAWFVAPGLTFPWSGSKSSWFAVLKQPSPDVPGIYQTRVWRPILSGRRPDEVWHPKTRPIRPLTQRCDEAWDSIRLLMALGGNS